ncbi:MAG: hypothetical protein U5J64_07400 [Halobacteriales archaeon]|nr:hypothetical protein [Halobacteriales archaeon]
MEKRELFVAVGVLLLSVTILTSGCITADNENQTELSDQEHDTTAMGELKINYGSGNKEFVEYIMLNIEGEEPVKITPPLPSEPVTEREIRFISPTSSPDSKPLLRYRLPNKSTTGLYDVKISIKYVNGEYVNGTHEDYLEYKESEDAESNNGMESLTNLKARPADYKYYVGNNAEITASFYDSEPIDNADVKAEVITPNRGTKTVGLESIGDGIYTAILEINQSDMPPVSWEELQNGSVTEEYNATVTATLPDGSTYEDRTSWKVDMLSAPVAVNQTKIPSVEPGETAEVEFEVASFGARSIEFGVSNLRRKTGNAIIKNRNTSLNTSSNPAVVTQEKIIARIPVPEDTEPGNYTGTLGALVTDSDASVVEPIQIDVESFE